MEKLEPFFRLKSNVKSWAYLTELKDSTRISAAKKIKEIYDRWVSVPENAEHIKNAMYIDGDLLPINLFAYLMALYESADEESLYNLSLYLKVYFVNINGRARYFIQPYCFGVFSEIFSALYEDSSLNIFNYDPEWSESHPVISELSESEISEREDVLNLINQNLDNYFTYSIIDFETLIHCDPNFSVEVSPEPDNIIEEEIDNLVGEDGET
jgi:hypothetical protein